MAEITAAPDAGGPLSFRNCPTIEEARSAVPAIVGGPDVNAVPFKTMLLQCSYPIAGVGVQGQPALVSVLVFDASNEGVLLWDSVLSDANFPNPVDIAGLGQRGFATGTERGYDLWVVEAAYGFHMLQTDRDGIPLDQMTALAKAVLTALQRPAR